LRRDVLGIQEDFYFYFLKAIENILLENVGTGGFIMDTNDLRAWWISDWDKDTRHANGHWSGHKHHALIWKPG
jgi:hypothetical protein